jgi:hypothetical protein
MLFQANMPQKFWTKALYTAAITLNYLLSLATKFPGKSGITNLSQLKRLHPFESIVHAYIPRPRCWTKGKLAPRSTTGCFIGYQLNNFHEPTTTYKYWDLEKQCSDYSHDLLFNTGRFPRDGSFDEVPATPPVPAALTQPQDDALTQFP